MPNNQIQVQVVDSHLDKFTPDERTALERYRRVGGPKLSPVMSVKLYELWMQGVSCQELHQQNPGLTLGAIMAARVADRWDDRREAHLADLFVAAGDRLKQIQAESLNFLGLMLAAAHRKHGEKLAKYLMTGDESQLGDLSIDDIKNYKATVETIAKLTGSDAKKTVTHQVAIGAGSGQTQGQSGQPITAETAAALLRALASKGE